ncbi:MAG: hypothetical protein EAZ85_05705 [Bacteroidetes bacterium]|nr:MAG: hypothetical protein EAZ85_05705 [Bacteroidota bacterium]TAG89169.1 MAG: hypothetical protein EAZ20_07055 [Bacteroidota bacterium]
MFDKILFQFAGASLPPQYYRSYTIEINQKKANIRVYNYSTDLLSKDFEIFEEEWRNLQSFSLETLEKQGSKIEERATGTTLDTIILLKDDKEMYNFCFDSLSKVNEATEKLKATILSLIKPSVEEIINSTRQ